MFDEVLPTLRKNGIYIADPLAKQFARDPAFAHAVVDALYAQTDRVVQQAMYIKDFIDPEGGVSLRVAAKQLNVPEHWFIRFLIKRRPKTTSATAAQGTGLDVCGRAIGMR